MPSSNRKKRSNLFDKSPKMLGEVTLYDFANSSAPKGGRIKKAVTNDLMIAHFDDQLEEAAIDDQVEELKPGRRRRRRKSSSGSTSSTNKDDDIESRPGKVYPLDLWFLLSDYIRPQDVLKFSLLCKASHQVVNTSKFWINLHKRYCKAESVPKKFGRECLEKRHGLKSAVVKALFLACPWLGSTPTVQDPVSVSGFLCILMWIEKTGRGDIQDSVTISSPKNWIYKFKLAKKQYYGGRVVRDKRLKSYCDINDNPDEGCKILTVPCWEYTAVPCVSGMRLSDINFNSTQLSLVFSSAPLNNSSSQMGNISIRLRVSHRPTVFDWWHPSYHNSSNTS